MLFVKLSFEKVDRQNRQVKLSNDNDVALVGGHVLEVCIGMGIPTGLWRVTSNETVERRRILVCKYCSTCPIATTIRLIQTSIEFLYTIQG